MTKKDFEGCKFNPMAEDFYVEELQSIGTEKQMAWVIMVHDPNSPLLKKYPNLEDRMKEAAALSGYQPQQDETAAIMGFLKNINGRLWAARCAIETALWEQMELIMTPITNSWGDDWDEKDRLTAVNMKKTTAANIIEMNGMLDTLDEKFVPSPSPDLSTSCEGGKRKRVSAEGIARQFNNLAIH
jgi:hypothetical protein